MIAPADICPGTGERPERVLAARSNGPTGVCPICHRSVNIGRHTGLLGRHKARTLAAPSDLEQHLLKQLEWAGLPTPEREYRFHPDRDWRFDLAWPAWPREMSNDGSWRGMVAVEVQGAIWTGGKHGRGKGIEIDHSKLNAAQLAGWTVLQYSRRPIEDGTAVAEITQALGRDREER